MTKTPITPSVYDPNKFVNREEEKIQQILSLLRQSQPRSRAIIIDGDRGAGKTWLSLHLHRTVFNQEITGITSWLFSLCSSGEKYRPGGAKEHKNERFVSEGEILQIEEFLEIILKNLYIENITKLNLAERVDLVRRHVQSHIDERFVLILDSAYESDWSFLEKLEAHFLGNLLTLNNFFVIITGRGRPYPWKVPYLIESVQFGLGKFSIEQIKEQINKLGFSFSLSIDEIYEIGQGWPLFTEHLARAKDRIEALDIAADILFTVIPAQDREQIRKYFEALCPLDGFGEVEAALMVKTYENNNTEDGRLICRMMNETHLTSWKNGRYEMNKPVQNILSQYLIEKNQIVWIQLQRAAYQYFEKQANDYTLERFSDFFKKQMRYHESALAVLGIDDLST